MSKELTMAAQQALAECPFCGADPQDAHHIEYGRWAVTCRCGASGASANTGPNATDAAKIKAYSDARTAWNTRALTQRPAAQTEGEAFEAWWPTVGQTIGKVAAWEAWQFRASLPAPQQATPEPDDDGKWRDVALRFDKHRMQALWHLQAMLKDPAKHADIVRQFLKDPTHPAAATPEPVGEPVGTVECYQIRGEDVVLGYLPRPLPVGTKLYTRPVPVETEPEWIVNDLGELGVRVGSRFFFLYKGDSIEYGVDGIGESAGGVALHDDGTPMRYRIVGKREFGETCWPLSWVLRGHRYDRYTEKLVYTPGLSFGSSDDGEWRDLPALAAAQVKGA